MHIPFRLRYQLGFYLGMIALVAFFALIGFGFSPAKTRWLGIPMWIWMAALVWLAVLLRQRTLSARTVGRTLLTTVMSYGFFLLLNSLIASLAMRKLIWIGF